MKGSQVGYEGISSWVLGHGTGKRILKVIGMTIKF